ncbi:hypothetical protein QL285_018460 [Trifolium repens]|nr:hypothetical protein QL285_018460 [Trifolium repens]
MSEGNNLLQSLLPSQEDQKIFVLRILHTKRLQIVPTAIDRIPPSGISNRVKGAETTNSDKLIGHLPPSHKLTTSVMTSKRSLVIGEPSPHIACNKCWACNPSLPHNVPLGNK